jgi:hypothetical protein
MFPLKMVIFHSYVSLPEGRLHQIPLRKWQMFGQHLIFCLLLEDLPIIAHQGPGVLPSHNRSQAYCYITRSHGHMGLNLKCKMFGGCYTPINPKDFEITKVVWFFIFIFHDLSVESSLLHQGYKVDSVDMSPRHARLVQVRVAGLALAGIQLWQAAPRESGTGNGGAGCRWLNHGWYSFSDGLIWSNNG